MPFQASGCTAAASVADLQAPHPAPWPGYLSGAPTGPSIYTKVLPETTGVQCSSGWPKDVSEKPHRAVYTLRFLPGGLEPGSNRSRRCRDKCAF